MDFYPTLAELAGATRPASQPIDGVSLLPILQETDSLKRDAVFWHFPCYIGRGEPSSAVAENRAVVGKKAVRPRSSWASSQARNCPATS